MSVPSDIAIAQAATMRPITDVAADIGPTPDDLDLYGKYKAKVALELTTRPAKGKLVIVTAINPTAAGEGKTTTSVGLAQALRKIGTNAVLCIREPSLGPVFGVKGGAAGGGYAQVLPMDDINLHFTGDFHAISSAHSLLSAMLDNHLQQGNALNIDPRRITWPRTIDMNDRALRKVVIGLGGATEGVVREERFVIIPASEVMAIVALATSAADLEERLGNIIVGSTYGAEVGAEARLGDDDVADREGGARREDRVAAVREAAEKAGARVALCEVFAKGGAGGEALAREVLEILKGGKSRYAPLYDAKRPIKEKIDTIVRKVYGGEGADYSAKADRAIAYLESIGLAETPICMAKTQYSLSDDATKLGRPTGFRMTVNDVYPVAGAGFVVAQCGEIMTMPGLPKAPAAEKMAIHPDGSISGLF